MTNPVLRKQRIAVVPSTKKTVPIHGKPQQPNFNGQGPIDLNTFPEEIIPELSDKSLIFSHIMFLDISQSKYSFNDLNHGIRENNIDSWEDHVEDLKQSLASIGFAKSQTLPWIYDDGTIGDGRSRFKAARDLGYKHFPVAVFIKVEGELTDKERSINSIKSNMKGFPQKRAKKNDFIANVVKALREKWIENNFESIKEFCHDTLELDEYYKNSSGTVTEIAKQAYENFNAGGNDVLNTSTSTIKDWLKDSGYVLDKKTKLVATNNETYALREFESILDSVNKGNDPLNFILYTKATNGDKARKDLDNFLNKLESLYILSQKAVLKNIEKNTGMKMTLPKTDERPWKVLGCIPQILGEHPSLEDTNQLISVKDY